MGAAVKLIIGMLTVSVPEINVKGAALGTLACYAVIFVLHTAVLLKVKEVTLDIKAVFLKPLVAAVICGISAHLIFKISDSVLVTALAIFAAALVYIIFLILENTFEENDFCSLPKAEKLTDFCKKHRIIR